MAITGVNNSISTISSNTDMNEVLGKDDFLKLLITQLSNQDPMEPLDNNQFIAQMTQFSSLEQLQGIKSGIETSLMLDQSLNNAMSTTLLGRDVMLQGNVINVSNGTSHSGGFYAATDGKAVVSIKDGTGNVISTIDIDVEKAGFIDIPWDFKDSSGNDVHDGMYSFEVSFTDSSGSKIDVSPYIEGTVTAVKFMGGNALLEVGGMEYNLSQVIEIRISGSLGQDQDPESGDGSSDE